jgi:hypothetical protein
MTTNTSTTTLESTIDRYIDSWNETDADARYAICREVWADDGRYVDPLVDATGPRAIADALGGLQAQLPGHRVRRVTGIDAHHDQARFGWTISAPDGSVAFAGVDIVAAKDDGRLHMIAGFLGDVEPAA